MAAKWIASQLVEVNPASASHGPSNSITHLYSSDVVLLAEAYSYRSPTFNPTAFGYLEQCGPGSAFEGVLNESFEASCVSPLPTTLTPSLCGDRLQTHHPSSPELSLRSPKRETLSSHPSPEVESEPKRPQRKRAPARLDRTLSDGLSGASAGSQRTTRLQHSLVERKYREGLNAGLERLRRAVPMLSRGDVGSVMGEAKPSKAMVLAGAIDYIKKVEQERDMLQDENARLRGISKGTVARTGRQ